MTFTIDFIFKTCKGLQRSPQQTFFNKHIANLNFRLNNFQNQLNFLIPFSQGFTVSG